MLNTVNQQRECKSKFCSSLLHFDNQGSNEDMLICCFIESGWTYFSKYMCKCTHTHITNSVSIFKKWILISLLSQLWYVCRFTLVLGKNTGWISWRDSPDQDIYSLLNCLSATGRVWFHLSIEKILLISSWTVSWTP